MWRGISVGTVLFGVTGMAAMGYAQTLPGISPPQTPQVQSPVTISPIQPSSAPTSGLPANVLTPSTTTQLEPSARAQSRSGIFNGAGRGLPGMPGGPALNSPMGAQDPSVDYMRPPTVGPLFCDPAINMAC